MRGHIISLSLVALGSAAFALPLPATAHPGGLNAEGCHNNRKTGDYHCHRGSRLTASSSTKRHSLSAGSVGVAFRNCAAARAAGAAPVRVGEPGYGPHLDRDRDGIGCEGDRGFAPYGAMVGKSVHGNCTGPSDDLAISAPFRGSELIKI